MKKVLVYIPEGSNASESTFEGVACRAMRRTDWDLKRTHDIRSCEGLYAGLLTILPPHPDSAAIETTRFHRHSVFINLFDTPLLIPNAPTINLENFSIGAEGAKHLLSKGLRNFAFVRSYRDSWSENRARGFVSEIEAAKRQHASTFLPESGKTTIDIHSKLLKWIRTLPQPCGLMADCDLTASLLLNVCHRAKLRVPADIAIISTGAHHKICEHANPMLSSLDLDLFSLGWQAAEVLGLMMDGKDPSSLLSQKRVLKVIERQSSAWHPLTGNDVVRTARTYIREHAGLPMRVEDVARHCGLCVRSLEIAFKCNEKHSLANEIKQARLDRVRKLLSETTFSTEEICRISGWTSPSHVKRLFKEEFGCGMSVWRQRTTQCHEPSGKLPATVLLVDDTATIRELYGLSLKHIGVKEVLTAESGAEALAILREKKVQVVLTDMWMPNMNGRELCDAIHKDPKLATIPVLALSADLETLDNFDMSGFKGILYKNKDPKRLRQLLSAIV